MNFAIMVEVCDVEIASGHLCVGIRGIVMCDMGMSLGLRQRVAIIDDLLDLRICGRRRAEAKGGGSAGVTTHPGAAWRLLCRVCLLLHRCTSHGGTCHNFPVRRGRERMYM